ncbi:MAG: hypothetical protein JST32_04175 [Bacteroidetes bacterium]|nr:hypothetical protein [Bacteroidota bacterium]
MHDDGAGYYWFYHKESFPSDCPLYYQWLIQNAKSEIEIWDPYFNIATVNGDQEIFNNVGTGLTIKILTSKHIDRANTYLNSVMPSIQSVIPSSKNVRFGMRVFNKADVHNQGGWFFHDRFLIIDGSEVYLIGGSIGWHLIPQEATGIFKVDHFETKDFIKSLFHEYWRKAYRHELPVRYI